MMTVTFRVTGGYCCPPPVLDEMGNVLRPGGDKIASGDTLRMPLDRTALPDLPDRIDMIIVSATPTTFPPAVPGGPHLAGYTYTAEYDETLLPPSVTSLRECDLLRTEAECLSCCDLLWEAIGDLQDRTSVLDTSTVDLTLNGTTITATAIIKPDSGLEATSTGIGAKVVDSTSVDLSLSSAGISAVVKPSASGGVIIDGPGGLGVGVKPDPSSPVSVGLAGVKVYSDPAGPITAGPSGINVTVNPSGPVTSGPSGLGVGVLNTTSVAMTASSSGISSVVLPTTNGGVVVDGPLGSGVAVKPDGTKGIAVGAGGVAVKPDESKGITVDVGGVAVKVSTASGNSLSIRPDGSLFVSPSGAPVPPQAAGCEQPISINGTNGTDSYLYTWEDVRPSLSAEGSLPLNPDGLNFCGQDTIFTARGDGTSTTSGDVDVQPSAGFTDQIFVAQISNAPNGDAQFVLGNQTWHGKTTYVDSVNGLDTGAFSIGDPWKTALGGMRGRADRPFATLQAAQDASSPGDVIIVRPGSYAGASITVDNLTFEFSGKSTITGISGIGINIATPLTKFTLRGFPNFSYPSGNGVQATSPVSLDLELGSSTGSTYGLVVVGLGVSYKMHIRGDWPSPVFVPSDKVTNSELSMDGNVTGIGGFGGDFNNHEHSSFVVNGNINGYANFSFNSSCNLIINGNVTEAGFLMTSTSDSNVTINGAIHKTVVVSTIPGAVSLTPFGGSACLRNTITVNGSIKADVGEGVHQYGTVANSIQVNGIVTSSSSYGWLCIDGTGTNYNSAMKVISETSNALYTQNSNNIEWKSVAFESLTMEAVKFAGNGGLDIFTSCRLISAAATCSVIAPASSNSTFKVYGGPLASNKPSDPNWIHANPLVNSFIVDATVTE